MRLDVDWLLGTFKELNLIVKRRRRWIHRSLDRLFDQTISRDHPGEVIHKAVGQISESDVLLASASDAIIIGFQVDHLQRPPTGRERRGSNQTLFYHLRGHR